MSRAPPQLLGENPPTLPVHLFMSEGSGSRDCGQTESAKRFPFIGNRSHGGGERFWIVRPHQKPIHTISYTVTQSGRITGQDRLCLGERIVNDPRLFITQAGDHY
jgi:hypothetical protein